MTISENDFRRRLIAALERIADALEAANRADPVQAIAAALGAEGEKIESGVAVRQPWPSDAPPVHLPAVASFADMPPAQRRALGLE